jgi:hypothetical protein
MREIPDERDCDHDKPDSKGDCDQAEYDYHQNA